MNGRACTVEPYESNFGQPQSPRQVTFVDQPGQFASIENNIDELTRKAAMPPPPSEFGDASRSGRLTAMSLPTPLSITENEFFGSWLCLLY